MRKTTTLTLAALAVGTFSFATSAAAQQCGETYTIKAGDTLSRIAKIAYGSTSDFPILYSANSDTIGPNPGRIEVGMRLDIPCLGGIQASTADSSAITQPTGSTALPPPSERAIRIVVGSDWAPFLHEDNEQGGMLTEIANVAMSQADGTPEYKIDFINDWGAHLQPLISDHAYDFSLAWFRPNCDVREKLGEGSQFRCNNLKWSEPMFEQLIGYYSRSADPAPQSYADLKGKTICRPAGYSTFMMEENDLVEPLVTIVRPNAVVECFTGLVDGSIDAVVLATDTAQGAITEIGAGDLVRFDENLGQIATLHAVISYNHPQADELLAVIDSGLTKIKNSGEWFNIVQRHLAAHRAANS